MKKTYKFSILILFTMVVLSGSADFLDINKDKNNPLTATLPQLLLTPEVMIFDGFGDGNGGVSDLTAQWAHYTVQRGPNNFYFMDGNEFAISTAWGDVYKGALEDLNIIIDQATKQGATNYSGIAKVLKAYTYATAVDIWGVAVLNEFGK